MNEKIKYAKKALDVMGISYQDNETIDILLLKLKNSVPLAASSTELEIRRLSKELAEILDSDSLDLEEIETLLDKLNFEVTFIHFD